MADQIPLVYAGGVRRMTTGDTFPTARMGSGTANSSTFLRGDQAWATPSAALDITGLAGADPALGDEIPIYDISASANRKITFAELGFLTRYHMGGRLTVSSGVAVPTGDLGSIGTIYYTPYMDSVVNLFDGTRWLTYTFTERLLELIVTSGFNYDVFLYDNAGTLTLELSAAWTDDTTRADALALQDGIWVKSGAATRRWVGTIRADGLNQTSDTAATRFVWNLYNQVPRPMRVVDVTNSWTYSTATWRQANANVANKAELVCGLATLVRANACGFPGNSAGTVVADAGIGIDSTSVNSAVIFGNVTQVTGVNIAVTCEYIGYLGIGYHYIAWLEWSTASGTTTWLGDNGGTTIQSGLMAEILA